MRISKRGMSVVLKIVKQGKHIYQFITLHGMPNWLLVVNKETHRIYI